MKAQSMKEAWNIANEIFPTDYEQDIVSSSKAGYAVYRSTVEGHYYDYICDLADRLEVNLSDGRTINIWIEKQAEEVSEAVKEMRAAKEYGKNMATELYTGGTFKKLVFAVDGSKWNTNETEKTLYAALGKDLATVDASDMIAEYCTAHGIKWRTISDIKITHYEHGNNNGGHYIVEAYIRIDG